MDTVAVLTDRYGAPQHFPFLLCAEHGHVRVLHHRQRNIACTVCRIVTLQFQIAGVRLGAAGDLQHTRVLQGHQVLPVGLLACFPLGIILRFLRYDGL